MQVNINQATEHKRHWIRETANVNLLLPSLSIQNKIVDILDNFEQACSKLNTGLPKEIELRNNQYEYYRDQIFNYLNANKDHRTEK
ncbi:restriction endonuclease subunit S [Mycoplasma tullyi]|uniref:Restriction endonuclease subunit S n=1 Tax=Mycoplasma tullyi TaxID=1612150 RepID=A0A7D7U8B7_9MOLU|nr:restriction endonuclease subunit S [Mycoplasma tullyi]QMT98305.1 restriction endonuclease subunit S [Mycoplasma tullyi]